MSVLYTIDASVIVAACRTQEPGHVESRRFLDRVAATAVPLIEPSLLIVETSSALSRAGVPAHDVRNVVDSLLGLPLLTVVALDEGIARASSEIARRHRLRAADAVYVATASLYGSRLVTLDREQLQRSPRSVRAMNP